MKHIIIFLFIYFSFMLYGDTIVDIGTFAANQTIQHKIPVENISDKILYLQKIRTSCTCADVKYLKAQLLPGESTALNITLKANSLSGPFTHTIYVETDNPKQRFMRFLLNGIAVPLLKGHLYLFEDKLR